MTHEEIREQLALSAAGLLPPKGESNIRNHIAECASCAAQFEILAAISHELTALPAPSPSPDLLARTHALMVAEAAALADRRRMAMVAVAAGLFAWVINLATWAVYQLITGGIDAVLRPAMSGLLAWLALSTLTAMLAAPASVALASRRRIERSI